MTLTVKQFKRDYKKTFENIYAFDFKDGSIEQQYFALGHLVRNYLADEWSQSRHHYIESKAKQVFYFSMEFLPGRQLKSNLYNMDILETVKEGLKGLEIEFEEVENAEVDPALGNGGLGRLASCFMDSLASLGLPGHGNGIRYRYGLFRQKFVDGYQVELPENWLRNGNVWEIRNMNSAVTVRFGGNVWVEPDGNGNFIPFYENTENILAVPYDTPMVGYKNITINNMRLWSAEVPPEEEEQYQTIESAEKIKGITEVLYPDDSNYEGRLLRLKQEYFMVSAGVQSIIQQFYKYNIPRHQLPEKIAIHINDTHPALVVPELMRILLDEEHLSWEKAWEITKKTCSYTNHTILKEAMEKWPVDMVKSLLPRMYQIIEAINQHHIEKKLPLYGERLTYATSIIKDGQINMAHLAVIGSHSVNGVAQLHTNILKNDVLHDFYEMYPYKFNNKTNGITQRRWLHIANPDLTKLITKQIGEEWKTNPAELKVFKGFETSEEVLEELAQVKLKNKEHLAEYIKENLGLEINPNALFDVQIKRLHAYKRQHLNALHILDRYLRIKENPAIDIQPRVFIFGAKAAPSYLYAKQIIKLINSIADMVNNDPEVGDKLKVVFFENYGVSLAEKIIPAAEISEQISLAGKEASGTSNMKLMLNGALTLATLDGANIEIRDYVGEENMFIFGLNIDEVSEFYKKGNYSSKKLYEKNKRLKRVLDSLIDGTIPGLYEEGRVVFDSLVHYNDEYFVLKDFDSYVKAHEKADELYSNKKKWNQKSLINIASSGPFSADYTIKRYSEEIWKTNPQKKLNEGVHSFDEPI
ncbi:glycogen/starch/alpha-glucan phosphorylase [Lacticigenium naphthae]|uniref:glycogen/starch/alpha-glucan phosphorylase n=1 Tax=Lacticigenium naphthae TaxID=515351 RepID=UPI0003FECDCE|nr:glycogen/starch/alpha-glucan phosphorylase [Lacticigenium naphthae]